MVKNCGWCTWSHYTIHTQDTYVVKFFARAGGNLNLAIIRPTQNFASYNFRKNCLNKKCAVGEQN